MQDKNNFYWVPEKHQQVVIVSTIKILNPCIYLSLVIYVPDIPISLEIGSKKLYQDTQYVSIMHIMIIYYMISYIDIKLCLKNRFTLMINMMMTRIYVYQLNKFIP